MSYFYLASPYSSPDPDLVKARHHEAMKAVVWLMKKEMWVHSPIVYCHDLAQLGEFPTDAEFWLEFNRLMLRMSKGMILLKIEGWDKSLGVREEIKFSNFLGIPILGMVPVIGGDYKIQ